MLIAFDHNSVTGGARIRTLLVTLSLALCAPMVASAAKRASVDAPQVAAAGQGYAPEYFHELWAAYREASSRGDAGRAEGILGEIILAKQAAGWPDFPIFAGALALESERAAKAGSKADALRFAQNAALLAPHYQAFRAPLMRAQWADGDFVGAARTIAVRVSLSFAEPPVRGARLGGTFLALAIGIVVAGLGLAIISIFRYARLMVHDLRHGLPSGARTWQAAVSGCAILLAPLLFRVGVLWTVLVWLLAMGLYYASSERIAAIGMLLMMAVIAFGLPAFTDYLSFAGSRAQDVYRAVRELDATDAEARIDRRKTKLPQELYALGLRAKWSGNLEKAKTLLTEALRAGATDSALHTTLGNVHLGMGQERGKDAALEAYKTAVAGSPRDVVAHFNMSRVYYSQAQHAEGGAAHKRASAIDLNLVKKFAKEAKQGGAGYVVAAGVPNSLLDVKFGRDGGHERALAQVWTGLAAGASRRTFGTAALVAALLLVGLAWIRRRLKLTRGCPRCGMPACQRCSPEAPLADALCGQCYYVTEGDDSDANKQFKIKKQIQVHRYQAAAARLSRLCALMLAGGGQLVSGAAIRGVIFLVAFASGWVGILASVGAIPSPTVLPEPGMPVLTFVVSLTVMALSYVLALWDGAREA